MPQNASGSIPNLHWRPGLASSKRTTHAHTQANSQAFGPADIVFGSASNDGYPRFRKHKAHLVLNEPNTASFYNEHPNTVTIARIVWFSHRSTTQPSLEGSQHAAELV